MKRWGLFLFVWFLNFNGRKKIDMLLHVMFILIKFLRSNKFNYISDVYSHDDMTPSFQLQNMSI